MGEKYMDKHEYMALDGIGLAQLVKRKEVSVDNGGENIRIKHV